MRGQSLEMVLVCKSLGVELKSLTTSRTLLWQGMWMDLHSQLRLSGCFDFKSSFPSPVLPATHPYHKKIAKEQHQKGYIPPTSYVSPAAHSSISIVSSSSNSMVTLDKSKLLAVCEHREHDVANATVATFLSDIKKLLN